MLKKLGQKDQIEPKFIRIADAEYPQLFPAELEFNAPARGMWNIVHTGMLIPESHQIFICAQGCLRGVILTAAEMNAMERMSFASVQENDLFDGTMEENIVESVSAILSAMERPPRAVLVFLSCIQLFANCDSHAVYSELRRRFPDVEFVECLMHPTMRKSGLTPDQYMRKQLYAPLQPGDRINHRQIAIIGNDRATVESSELLGLLKKSGYSISDITYCRSYEEYLKMAECGFFISYYPTARAAKDALCQRFKRCGLHISLSYRTEEILSNYRRLTDALAIEPWDTAAYQTAAEAALLQAKKVVGSMPIAIDYTATLRVFSLARMLLENNFNVDRIYSDVAIGEDAEDFAYLQQHYPDLKIYPTLHPRMRFAVTEVGSGNEFLAIGQKAACFTGTEHLVNIVSGGGWYGFDGIRLLAEKMQEAALNITDIRREIQLKGWGCESCL